LITLKPIMSVLLQTNLAVSQTIISFGPVKVGTSSTQSSVLTNIGNSTITLTAIGLTGPAPSYTVGNGCGPSLAAGASCTLTLTLTPKKTGTLTAKVRIGYSGTVGTPQYIEMSGEGN
jgi:trimeric autotransporter adhesin